MTAQSGIYQVLNTVTSKCYIGGSKELGRRLSRHKTELSKNTHPNKKLQRAWNKYGPVAFTFRIIENCEISELTAREQYWINHHNAVEAGYNICPQARTCAGRKLSARHVARIQVSRAGYRHSEQTREKMRLAQTGKKRSPQHINNMSKSLTGMPKSREHIEKVRSALKGIPRCDSARLSLILWGQEKLKKVFGGRKGLLNRFHKYSIKICEAA